MRNPTLIVYRLSIFSFSKELLLLLAVHCHSMMSWIESVDRSDAVFLTALISNTLCNGITWDPTNTSNVSDVIAIRTKSAGPIMTNVCSNTTRFYLLVPCAGEGVLDRMWWVSALLAAEAPLAGGIARATGHPGSVLAGCCYFTDHRF